MKTTGSKCSLCDIPMNENLSGAGGSYNALRDPRIRTTDPQNLYHANRNVLSFNVDPWNFGVETFGDWPLDAFAKKEGSALETSLAH